MEGGGVGGVGEGGLAGARSHVGGEVSFVVWHAGGRGPLFVVQGVRVGVGVGVEAGGGVGMEVGVGVRVGVGMRAGSRESCFLN